jgi:hypothetical protein
MARINHRHDIPPRAAITLQSRLTTKSCATTGFRASPDCVHAPGAVAAARRLASARASRRIGAALRTRTGVQPIRVPTVTECVSRRPSFA